MIPEIRERNFPEHATLHQATVSLSTMGDRTITTQIRVDGSIAPEFGVTENGVFKPMELEFRGERFILPTREPQARKDTSTKNSLIDLTFYSWPVYELKRYFFVEMSSTTSGTAIADKYDASLALNLENFVDAFNLVLDHYFNGKIQISLFGQGQGIYSTDPVFFEINYTKLWEVLQKVYEMYNVRWWFDYDSASEIYLIKMGYTADSIDDHDFSYGYKGGLLSFERTVQSDDLVNILLGRGGEKNLPYRYFKRTDPGNPGWTADPDAIPELANIYFDRLHDVNFRWYVRGWMTNPNRDQSWEQEGYVYPTYSISPDSPYYFAYQKGATDAKFNPVEYVKDDESIAAHGEVWGALDDNDDIYPTIQGVTVNPYGRIDESVAISQIETDDVSAYASAAAVETTIKDMYVSEQGNTGLNYTVYSKPFTIAQGEIGNVTYRPFSKETVYPNFVYYDTTRSTLVAEPLSGGSDQSGTASYDESTGLYAVSGIPAGTYRLKLNLVLRIDSPATAVNGTFGIENVVLTTSAANTNAWKPTFDIWVKNLWQTTQGANESNKDYAERVWGPILGDRLGDEAKIVFSTGAMSISQDYEFVIADYPVPDRTKTLNGIPSEWKITVYKSDAEYQATGLYIPNASSAQPLAGDKFFFVGIDMPFQYVEWAEERLNQYKTDNLEGMSDISPTWTLKLDKVRINSLEDEDYGQKLADRLDAGVMIRTTDPRFTHGDILSLYIQSITWTWNEPSKGNPYIVPDVEVILADKVSAVESPISRLENDVNVISQTYVQSGDVEAVVRRVAGALFLKKTGESDSSSSPTTFSSKVTSRNFRKGGIGGAGWGLYEDNSRKFSQSSPATRADVSDEEETVESRTVLEVDRLVVREEMEVNNLVINQISARGGREIISAARIETTLVRETDTSYVCYFDQKQNSVANLFKVNDIAYGQVWSADNTELRFYKMRVSAVDVNSITLAKSGRVGSGTPQEGDVIVQYGNTTDPRRQYVIVRDVIGGGHDRMLSGLDSVSADGKEYYYAGVETGENPRWFVGDKLSEYAEYKDGQLNIKGRLSVLKSDGTYQAMADYINSVTQITNNLQSQIDGQIQSWSGDGQPLPIDDEGVIDPTTANYPANQWTDDTARLKHMGDIYVDNISGQGYRYTRQANDGDFYWMRISDEDVALALSIANQALSGVAGLQYLKTALEGSTTIAGGLVLSTLIQLGKTEDGAFNVYSGINGGIDVNAYGNGIAAWYGGPMIDHEAEPTAPIYANSLFRFDGSGYLAGGLLKWGVDNGEAFLNLNGEAVVGGLDGVTLNDVANLMFDVVPYGNGHYAAKLRGYAYYNGNRVPLDGLFSDGWISAGGISGGGGGQGAYTLPQLNDVDDDIYTGISAGKALVWDGSKWTAGSVSTDLSGYLPLTAGSEKPLTGALHLSYGSSASDRTKGLNINNAHIGSSGNLLGLYSAGTIVLRPGGSTTDGLELTESAITFNGSALLTRAVADPLYLDKLIYLNGNTSGYGVLVKTTLRAQDARQPVFHITGNPYSGSVPIDTWVTFYNYLSSTSSMSGVKVVHNGHDLGDIHAFNYNPDDTSSPTSGYIYIWFASPARYASVGVSCWNAHNNNYPYNLVDTVTYAPLPDTSLMARHSVIRSGSSVSHLRKTYPRISGAEGWYRIGHYSGHSSGYELTFGSSYHAQVAQWVKLFVHGQSSSGSQMRQIEVLGSNANTMLTKARVVYESATVMHVDIWLTAALSGNNWYLTYSAGFVPLSGLEYIGTEDAGMVRDITARRSSWIAETADALETSRSLWGQPFNGSADILGDMAGVGRITMTPKESPAQSGNVLEVVNIAGEGETPVYALHSTLPIYSDGFISAGGMSDTGGGSLVSSLNDLSDVALGTLSDGQALVYDSGVWVNRALSLNSLSDVTVSDPVSGQALIYNGSQWVPQAISAGGEKVFYGKCTTDQGTATKVVVCPEFTAADIEVGTTIIVMMSYENTANSPTLNINSTGARPILIDATTQQGSGYLAGWWGRMEPVVFTFTGNGWNIGGGKIVATNVNYGQVKMINDPEDLADHTYEYGYTGSAYCLNEIYKLAKNGGGGGGGTAGVTSVAGYTGVVTAAQLRAAIPANATTMGVVRPMGVRNVSASNITYGGETEGRYYGVELNSNGQMFVNVPWIESSTPSGSYLPLSGGTMAGTINSQAVAPKTAGTITIGSTGLVTALGNGYDLGTESKPYRSLRTKVIYLGKNGNDDVYVYYDTVNKCVRVHGAGIATDSFVSAGGVSTTSN